MNWPMLFNLALAVGYICSIALGLEHHPRWFLVFLGLGMGIHSFLALLWHLKPEGLR